MVPLRIGVIGANVHLRANMVFRQLPLEGVELAAICDRDPEAVAEFRATYPRLAGARVYGAYPELIADPEVEAVFVRVRDQYHEEIAVAALKAGKAVFLEKPMALDVAGCDLCNKTPRLPHTWMDDCRDSGDVFNDAHPDTVWRSGIDHAVRIGLGSDEYELVTMK